MASTPGSPATVLLFWDYDTQWGADRSRMPGGSKNWGGLEFPNTDRLLDILDQFEVPSCFAVVGAAALPGERPYHDPDQVRRINAAGHEVASHSLHHDWLPGLGRDELSRTLRESRDALEQCVGRPVRSFVPPFNQPFDYAGKLSISLSERREGAVGRVGVAGLCRALAEAGYDFCRIYYRSGWTRIAEKLTGRRIEHPSRLVKIAGIHCVRLNTPCGFVDGPMHMLDLCARRGGIAVAYGHPHSITADGWQNEKHLLGFLARLRELRREGRIRVALPRELVSEQVSL